MPNPLGFYFLVLTTSQLIIRPAAFSPIFASIPFLQIFIIPCLLFSVAGVQQELSGRSLSRNPISAFLLGLTFYYFISSMINLDPAKAAEEVSLFIKSLIYYLLLVANVKSYKQIIQFGIAYTLFMLITCSVAMANYYHFVDMPGYKQIGEAGSVDPVTGILSYNYRLSGPSTSSTGDPNDLCLMILPAILFSGHYILAAPQFWQKFLALATTVTLFRAVTLTQSRGGLLGLLVGCAAWFVIRFGIRKSIPFVIVGTLGLLTVVAGRQTDFSMTSGSGQVRIQVWLSCINLIKSNPVLGVGPRKLTDYSTYVAHNSFVQAFVELGIPGGVCFLGVFFAAWWCLYWTRPHLSSRVSPELWRLRHLIQGILLATIVSMNALSRTYAMETFIVVGLASAYYSCISDEYRDTSVRTDFKLIGLVTVLSVVFLILVYVKVRTST